MMIRWTFISMTSAVFFLATACGSLPGPAPAPQLSATDLVPKATALSELPPTWTLEPTPTSSPTPQPSPTPLPTQDPSAYRIDLVLDPQEVSYPKELSDREGWKQVIGKTASLSLPASFEELDVAGVFLDMMFGMMQAFAEGFLEFAGDLGAAPQATPEGFDLGEPPGVDFLLAIEETSRSAVILASVERSPETTTEDLLNQALSGGESEFQVAAREVYLDSPLAMERVILDVMDEELGAGKQVIYAILGDTLGWNLIFTTPADLYPEYLPLFESVVDSFAPLP